MTTAFFNTKLEFNKKTYSVYGSIKVNNEGKESISIHNANFYPSPIKFRAKKVAKEIIAANFIHESVTEIEKFETGKIVDQLIVATVELKELYIQQTRDWAERRYDTALLKSKRTSLEWYEIYKIPTKLQHGTQIFDYLIATRTEKEMYNMMREDIETCKYIISKPKEKYVATEIEFANKHYLGSIERLAVKLNKKGITDETKITIKSSRIGVNVDCVIEHDNKITRCWTIVASGEIQRPHYRFLIK